MTRKTKEQGLTNFGPQVSAKNTEEYIAANMKGDAFARHRFEHRMMNGHYHIRVHNRGHWRQYCKISHASARRVNQLQRKYGTQVDYEQFVFPDRIECLDKEKTIRELGFGQYMEAK